MIYVYIAAALLALAAVAAWRRRPRAKGRLQEFSELMEARRNARLPTVGWGADEPYGGR